VFLNHVAVYCSSETESDKFYGNLLGLKKSSSRILPSALMGKIFGINTELKMINYSNNDICFEVFIGGEKDLDVHTIGHSCFEVDDREAFIKECETMNLKINKVPRGDSFIFFISDYDKNLFEIKERQKS
jgi:catechol 2,3-dioxygenase-like lactoylglutathione lyase family enzyme